MESLRLDKETNDFLPNNASSQKKIYFVCSTWILGQNFKNNGFWCIFKKSRFFRKTQKILKNLLFILLSCRFSMYFFSNKISNYKK